MDMKLMKANPGALDGEWEEDLEGFGDFAVKIKSLDHPEADSFQQQLFRTMLGRRVSRKAKGIPPAVRDYVYCKTLIEVCVVDWRNWEEDGKQVPYSKEKLEEFLLMDAPNGIKVGRLMKVTPDKKAYNFEGKFLYGALLEKAQAVDLLDDEDDDEDITEKNLSKGGSKNATASKSG